MYDTAILARLLSKLPSQIPENDNTFFQVMESEELRKECGLQPTRNDGRAVGMEDDRSYAEKNRVRWKKGKDFFSSPGLSLKLSLIINLMRPSTSPLPNS